MNKYRYLTTLCFAILFVPAFAETIYNGANPDDVAAWNTATATKLTVAADDTVSIKNGEFQLTAGTPSFGAGSTFEILDGAKLFATNSARQFALTASNSRILLDGGYLKANVNDTYGLFSGTPSNCRWDIVNGSVISMTGVKAYPHMSGSNNVICVVNSTNVFDNTKDANRARSMKFYKAQDCVWRSRTPTWPRS